MSFPRYPSYKDSGVEWLVQVPEHWEVASLTRIAKRVVVGIAEAATHAYADEGIPILRSTNIRAGRIIGDLLFIDPTFAGDRESKLINAEDLITVRTGNAGVTAVIPPHLDGCQCFTMLITTLNSGSSSRYYCYWMNSLAAQCYFALEGWGTAQVNISVPILKALPVPLPPRNEQTAIVEFLGRETGKIDELVAEQRRLMELLKEKRQAVISHTVTQGLNLKAQMKDSGIEWLGEVPEHWEEYPLKALMTLKHGYAFDSQYFSDSGDYVLMTPGSFDERGGFRARASEKFYVGLDFPNDFILQGGQMLVAMTEQAPGLLGSALFVPDGVTYLHNQRLGLVENLRRDKVNEKYLFHLFNSCRYRAEISISSTGAKVKHTSPQRILWVKIFLPPLSEQEQIGSFIDEEIARIDALEAEAQRAIDLLQERRTALISAAVTGQIDVRAAA